jgi:hypothetical protein
LEKCRVPPGRRDWFTITANPGVETPGYFQNVPAGQVKGNLRRLSFEIFIPAIILDGNSQIRFHKAMLTKPTAKTTVHAVVHTLRSNTS